MQLLMGVLRRRREGAALFLSITFVAVFSALAVAMAPISGANVQLAGNEQRTCQALTNAQSGLETVRYHLNVLTVSASAALADEPETRTAERRSAWEKPSPSTPPARKSRHIFLSKTWFPEK